ncbi:TPA: hypothetical protein HA244_03395 [Candidatus Micrarchaeota archaeon]|nr:hypothetical protein [Candidatus Micrarchaeota archaeon]
MQGAEFFVFSGKTRDPRGRKLAAKGFGKEALDSSFYDFKSNYSFFCQTAFRGALFSGRLINVLCVGINRRQKFFCGKRKKETVVREQTNSQVFQP